jgi:conjugal transfer pilus assembly protein TraL
MDEYYIPKHLDTPKKYLIFTIDEVIIISVLFLIFVFVLKQNLLAIIVCGLSFHGLRKLKGEKTPHYLLHLAYWHLPPFFKFRQIPPSYKKRFLG